MEQLYTPKQVGLALGVSESSVKRWCDAGRLRAAKTAGGHRKVPLSSVVELVRDVGHAVPRPDLLGLVAAVDLGAPVANRDRLFDALVAGDEATCRELLLGGYQRGASIVELGDELIGPVMRRVGDEWEHETIRVHHERRASETVMAVLHELRRWLPPPAPDAPVALRATGMRDFAETPIRLVELVFIEAGWNTVMAGCGLPLEEIAAAVIERDPRLVCLSLTHLEDVDAYIAEHNDTFDASVLAGRRLIVGGGAFDHEHCHRLRCDLFAARLKDLKDFLDAGC